MTVVPSKMELAAGDQGGLVVPVVIANGSPLPAVQNLHAALHVVPAPHKTYGVRRRRSCTNGARAAVMEMGMGMRGWVLPLPHLPAINPKPSINLHSPLPPFPRPPPPPTSPLNVYVCSRCRDGGGFSLYPTFPSTPQSSCSPPHPTPPPPPHPTPHPPPPDLSPRRLLFVLDAAMEVDSPSTPPSPSLPPSCHTPHPPNPCPRRLLSVLDVVMEVDSPSTRPSPPPPPPSPPPPHYPPPHYPPPPNLCPRRLLSVLNVVMEVDSPSTPTFPSTPPPLHPHPTPTPPTPQPLS